jgi:hypothetical protein
VLELAVATASRDEIPPVSMKQVQDLTDLHGLRVPPKPKFTRRSLGCRLTVKLRGRPEARAALRANEAFQSGCVRAIERRGRMLSFRARGADTQTVHGPLQRLLAVMTRSSAEPAYRADSKRAVPQHGLKKEHD